MTVGEMRKAMEGLPDDMEVFGESWDGQRDVICGEVCTHENGGLQYPAEYMEDREAFDPECWSPLDKPTFRIMLSH